MKSKLTDNIKKSYRTRAFRAGSYSIFAGLFVVAIAVVINLLMSALPNSVTSKDVSDTGLYTVSQQTKQIVSALNQDITVYWLVQPTTEETAVTKLLDNYKDLSSRITVKKIDPVEYPNFAKKYNSDQVYNNTLIVECGNKSKVLGYYDIYKYNYKSDSTSEEGYSYDVSFNGEEVLTSALSYVTSSDLPTVYALTGHGEAELPDTLCTKITDENFTLNKDLNLLSKESIPDDCNLLIINAPQSDLSSSDADKLAKYLQSGGKLMLVTGIFKDTKLANLESVMSSYGVTRENGIVIEGDNDHTIWNYNYYLLPDLDTANEITKPIADAGYKVLIPIASGLTVSDKLPNGISVTKLLTTSDKSFSKSAGLDITTYDKETGDMDGPFALAVAITGTAAGSSSTDSKETRIVWLSSGMILDENTNSSVSGANYDFFLNSMGWMSGAKNSISIRPKNLSRTTLTVTSGEAARMSLIIVALLPLLVMAIGIYVFVRRKRR